MKPLPKIVGVLGSVAAIYGSLEAAGVFNYFSPNVRAIVIAVGAALAALSHSRTGTGGEPAK